MCNSDDAYLIITKDLAGLPPPTNEPFIPEDSQSALHLFDASHSPSAAGNGNGNGNGNGYGYGYGNGNGNGYGSSGHTNGNTYSSVGGVVRGKAANVVGRTFSFSQYPRCSNASLATVEQGSCNSVPKEDFKYMGYTVRTPEWRYTAWLAWDGTKYNGDWDRAIKAGPYAEELYDHAADDGTDFDAFENVNLVAPGAPRSQAVQAARTRLLAALVQRFAS